ncbi:hypothetical protein BVC93_04050 [Mycobacterium sp. MS1601]|nr:hypothetical protein [Mycobacterium sp. MS1601]AQA01744.1 hypothetical protein BVC93_04050 [Mycobacterium sp. MS1601]
MYLLGLVVLIVTVIAKKNVVAPAIIATFLTGLVYAGSVTTGLAAVFNAAMVGTRELLPIFLIIALVTAMLGAVRQAGAETVMIRPLRRLFHNGHISYVVLAVVTFLLSLTFWPTPVLPLIAAILLPAAVRVGLPPFGAALAIAIAGQGMALSSDLVMGVAPSLSAEGANVPAGAIALRATIIALIAGVVALTIAYLRDVRTKMLDPVQAAAVVLPVEAASEPAVADGGDENASGSARLVAFAVPAVFAVLLVVMLLGRFTTLVPNIDEGLGAPLVGGTAALALVAVAILVSRKNWLGDVGQHFTEGIGFSFRTMGMVIPVAGFVYIGLSDYSGTILGVPEDGETPAFLLDAVAKVEPLIPSTGVFAAFAMLLIGMVIGLDGSGWPGLPFTGSLAGSLGDSAGVDVATLAAIAQNGASWTGGGTLVIWSSLIVVAGLTGVSVMDLARRLFVPVVVGLVVATTFAAAVLL